MSKVSIILPSYNHGKFLLDRLNSIFNQTYKDWEAIIIDDKSTDNSTEIISSFLEKNSEFKVKHFIVNEKNLGSGYFSWQKGIDLAETEYIWIAESDDFCEPIFLEDLIKILDSNQNISLAFCGSNYFDNNNIIYNSAKRTEDLDIEINNYKIIDSNIFFKRMPFNTYITNGSSVVFRKPKNKIPSAIFNNRLCSDIFLWSYLLQNSSFGFLNKNLNFFRRHEESTSTFLLKNKLETVYHERANYLNYFGQTEKYEHFINHYIKHYIWTHKSDFLNTSSIQKIQTTKNLKVLYFYKLIQFFISKLLRK
jgi:glycosyltransferase involved in cell wall biosynthesis